MKVIDVESVVELWRGWYAIDIKPEFGIASQIELWRCAECSLLFFEPESLAGSARMYSELEENQGELYYPTNKWEYEVALRDLQGCKRILEVGCGSGNFLALARGNGGLQIEGLEQNTKAIRTAVQRGFHVREATVEEVAKQSPGSFDAICSFQVLEHVPKPAEFLHACCALLRPGGSLILAVPNQDAYIRWLRLPLNLPPHHMTRWTRRPFVRLQAHFPLKLIRTAWEPLPNNQVEMYVDAYDAVLRRRSLGFLMHPWIRTRAIRLIRRSGMGRFLRGQNMYARYLRT